MHDPPITMIVVQCHVLNAPVVPECQSARLPPQAAGEFRPRRVCPQIVEKRPAFFRRPIDDVSGEAVIADIENRLVRLAVRSHERVYGGLGRFLRFFQFTLHDGRAAPLFVIEIESSEICNRRFHTVRQCVVCEVEITEERIAAGFWDFLRIQHRPHRGCRREHLIGMPLAAKCVRILRVFHDFDDLGMIRQTGI